jgi:dihydrolipoamide dehydrogenase
MSVQVAVVGGGPGGYTAAIRAAQLGAKVLLVEQEQLGGVCLNRGCIPTKTLLKSAEKWRELQNCAAFGLKAEGIGFDFSAVAARKNAVVAQLQSGIVKLVNSHAIEVVYGTAKLQGPQQLTVSNAAGSQNFRTDKIILATGSAPVKLPVPGGDLPAVLDSDGLLNLTEIPQSMIVVGAGAVGIEFAAIFQAFGCQVTVVEMLPALLPTIDSDLVKRVAMNLRKRGIKILTGTTVKAISQGRDGLSVEVENKQGVTTLLAAEKVLAATGRRAVVEGLGLAESNVKYTRQGISANEKLETNLASVYAIGDVTGEYMWAHAAAAEGVIAAENALGGNVAMNYQAVPGCVFITPEIAVVGLTEQEAVNQNRSVVVSCVNFAGNGKALSMGEAEGLVKVIADSATYKVLGMHIFGPHASDLIMEGVLAIRHGLTAVDLGTTIHPHPTLAETTLECSTGIYGDMIHQLKLNYNKR